MAEEQQVSSGSSRKALEPWAPLNSRYFLAVPEFFLDRYAEFELTPGEAMFVLHLLRHRKADGFTSEKIQDLANRMGMSYNQIRKYIAKLKREGYLRVSRVKGKPCIFDLRPLCERLEARRQEVARAAVERAQRL